MYYWRNYCFATSTTKKWHSAGGLLVIMSPALLSSHCHVHRIAKMLSVRKNPSAPRENSTLLENRCAKIEPWVCVYACVCLFVKFWPMGCAALKSRRGNIQRLLISIWVEDVHSWLPWEDRNYTLPEGRWQSGGKKDWWGIGGSEGNIEMWRDN